MLRKVVCAIYTNDEGKAIAVARHLMRDMTSSDGSRIYALLATLCQSPISWYTSGPAQKFILRQIKLIDVACGVVDKRASEYKLSTEASPSRAGLDISLLMLYGHILFTSTSYTYAIGT
jgi:general transcription factor 3C polypeptide 3 (transcription factor C subunit 4)